jgi:hypothetical protein
MRPCERDGQGTKGQIGVNYYAPCSIKLQLRLKYIRLALSSLAVHLIGELDGTPKVFLEGSKI